MRFLFLLPAHRPGRPRSLYRASFEGRRRRRRIRRFRDGYVRGGASAQAPTGCYFRALWRSNRAASVSAFGTPPRSPPPGFRPPSGLRGFTHSARRSDFTRRHASARFASAETVQPHSVSTLRRACSAGATAFYRPSFHCGRQKAKKQRNACRICFRGALERG